MQKDTGLRWSNATRVAFLIADCPCHGNEFHSLGSDDHPGGTPGIDIITELKILQAKKGNGTMTLNFGRITSHTDRMVNRFHELGISMDVVNIHDTAKITACVTKSVRKSIFKTMTFASGGTKSVAFGPLSKNPLEKKEGLSSVVSLKAYTITPDEPSTDGWMCQPAVAVKVFRNRRIKSFDDLQAPLGFGILKFPRARTDKTSESTMFMRRSTEPFAKGEIRIAYHAQLSRQKKDLVAFSVAT